MEGGRGERCCELKKRLAGRRFSIFRGLCISSFFHFPISSEVWMPRPCSLLLPQQLEGDRWLMRFVQSCLFAELGRVDIYPTEATACSVGAPSLELLNLERQVRVPSSLSSPRPQLQSTLSHQCLMCFSRY
jgi:hypothetical protein